MVLVVEFIQSKDLFMEGGWHQERPAGIPTTLQL